MSLPWITDESTPDDSYTEEDADPIISEHSIHWLICIETYSTKRKPTLGTVSKWSLEYDHPETCLYKCSCSNEVIIGFRGTKAVKDLYDDIKITLDQVFPRSKEAIEFINSLLQVHPYYNIELCGHSLGGAIARTTGKALNLRSITFNAAAPPTAPVISGPNDTDYHIVFDIISAWQSPNTIRINKGYKPEPNFWQKMNFYTRLYGSLADILEAHKLHNFSNTKSSIVITGDYEHQLLTTWMNSLPKDFKPYIRAFLFGVSGILSFPPLS